MCVHIMYICYLKMSVLYLTGHTLLPAVCLLLAHQIYMFLNMLLISSELWIECLICAFLLRLWATVCIVMYILCVDAHSNVTST